MEGSGVEGVRLFERGGKRKWLRRNGIVEVEVEWRVGDIPGRDRRGRNIWTGS